MNRHQGLLVGGTVVVAAILASAWAYPHLPDSVPSHWDLAGNVNGYSSRLMAAVLNPAILIFTWLLMLVLPIVSPRGFRLDQSAAAFYESVVAIMIVIVVINIPILRAEVGGAPPSIGLIIVPIGGLLVILGNLAGKLRKNFFIGIRTPWTLASDEVWLKTNRFTGRLMVIAGVLVIASSFFPPSILSVILVSVGTVVIAPIVYSYVLYKRSEGFGENGTENS